MAREYKDSGIEWIGLIPKEWEVKRVKYASDSINKGNGITKEEVFADGDTPCVRYGEIYSKYNISFDHCFSATRKEIQKSPRYFNKGDILFAGTGELVEEIGKNIVYLGEEPCLAGGDIIVLSHHQSPSFFNYALNCHSSQAQKSRNKAKLKVVHISASEIGDILITLPSLAIQQKIADYLDKVCGEVDEMVTLQETMIEELKAYKQSVITEAVTKGLNPNVPMHNSGVDWIGEIPEHWSVCKLKHCLKQEKNSLRVGPFGSALSGNDFKTEGYWVYNQRCVLDNNFSTNDTFVDETKYNELKGFEVLPGDILITTRGSIGKIAVVPNNAPKGILHPCIIRFVIDDSLFDISLLQYIFNESDFVLRQMRYQSNSTTIDVLYSYALRNILLTMPPISEQHAIASYLGTKCSEIDSLIALKQAKIEELKEYKKSVIYEYVTGKKEVV